MPLWNIAPKLTNLSLLTLESFLGDRPYRDTQEQVETDVIAVKATLPSPFAAQSAKDEYHVSIIARTIVAAARGGKLRRMYYDPNLQRVCAIRALLPFWVQMEQ